MSTQDLTVKPISLDSVIEAMKQWREAKKEGKSRVIPDELWRQIFSLSQSYEAKIIRGLLSISKEQYDKKYRQLIEDVNQSESPSTQPAETVFCEAKISPYKPSSLPKPATDLFVVEICRPDKSLLKIHATDDKLDKLDKVVQSFLTTGVNHVTNNQ